MRLPVRKSNRLSYVIAVMEVFLYIQRISRGFGEITNGQMVLNPFG
jgi:hypothetical protein